MIDDFSEKYPAATYGAGIEKPIFNCLKFRSVNRLRDRLIKQIDLGLLCI